MHSPTLSAVSPLSPIPTMEERGDMGGRSSEIDPHTCDTVGVVTGPTKLTRRLGTRLKKLRKAQGLTQEQAAELLGVTRARWGQMERGNVTNLTKLEAACEAIGARLIVDVQAKQ